jgi:hypothetical protein
MSSPMRPPKQQAPALTCDCHFHLFVPYDEYPLSPGRTYNPPPALVPAPSTRQRILVSNPAKLNGF